MKQICVYFVIVFLCSSCYKPNIYNDGTAWKMPYPLKVSDFYYDIENVYQYEGRHQEYKVKVKSFFWQDENNKNHTIESAFFIVKRFATGGDFDYALQYRRYDILKGETAPEGELYPDKVRNLWDEGGTNVQRGSTLYLTNSDNERFVFGMPHRTGWTGTDGLYENYTFSMFFREDYIPFLTKLLYDATEFRFYFPSDNFDTNGFKLEATELEYIEANGTFVELENNSFSLSKEELEKLKIDLQILIKERRKEPSEYIEQMQNEILK